METNKKFSLLHILFFVFEYFIIDSADLITEETVATSDINGDQ